MNRLPIHCSKLLILLVLGYFLSLSLSLVPLFISSELSLSLSLILDFSLSFLSFSSLFDWLMVVGMGSNWVASCCGGGGGLLWMSWIVDRPMVVGHAMGFYGCGGPFVGLWWLNRWVTPWVWWVGLWWLGWVSIRLLRWLWVVSIGWI